MIRNINPTNIIRIIRIGLINFTIKITKNKMTKNLFIIGVVKHATTKVFARLK